MTIPANGTYSGKLPGLGAGELVSAVLLSIINATTKTPVVAATTSFGTSYEYTLYTVSSDSIIDVTSQVQQDGSIVVNENSTMAPNALENILYVSYARRSYSRACIPSSEAPQNILQNGSFTVDHFSATGARVTTEFLENYVLVDGVKELMMDIGNYIWEDSVENPDVSTFWTPNLPHSFEEQHGVSIHHFLTGNMELTYYSTP